MTYRAKVETRNSVTIFIGYLRYLGQHALRVIVVWVVSSIT